MDVALTLLTNRSRVLFGLGTVRSLEFLIPLLTPVVVLVVQLHRW